jgi:hypothetical protein
MMVRVDQTRQNDVAGGINDLGAIGSDVRLDGHDAIASTRTSPVTRLGTSASIVTMVPLLNRVRTVSDIVYSIWSIDRSLENRDLRHPHLCDRVKPTARPCAQFFPRA